MTSKRFQQNMRTSLRKYWCHVLLCITRNEVWNVTVSNSICFRRKSCVQLLKQDTKLRFADTSADRSFIQEMAAAHYDITNKLFTIILTQNLVLYPLHAQVHSV